MSAYVVGQLVGALLATFLLTRLARRFTGKDYRGAILAFAVVLVLALGLFSLTTHGPDEFLAGAWPYVLSLIVWLVVDLGSVKRRVPGSKAQ
jgi:hypothetical protein